MIFEWDLNKNLNNIAKHGLDFELARYILADKNKKSYIDNRKEYGERRYLVYGLYFDDVFCVCYTRRGETYRIISLRYTHKKERRERYDNN